MFNKGAQLTNGLIDRERLYKIMSKVKSLAGTNQIIDYDQVAQYSDNLEQVKCDDDVDK